LKKDPNNAELIAKKASSEAFIANYDAEEKMKQAEKSL
jgi:hypothetical protein